MENKKSKRGLWITLGCVAGAVVIAGSVTLGVCLARHSSVDTIEGEYVPGSRYTIEDDDNGVFTLGVETLSSKEDFEKYGLKYYDGEESYAITPVLTAADSGEASLIDIASYTWTAIWKEPDSSEHDDETGKGPQYTTGNITSATDYNGDVWNEDGNGVTTYISFTEGSNSIDEKVVGETGYSVTIADTYNPGDEASIPATTATIEGAFGTPIAYTLTVEDYGGNSASATVRFDYACSLDSDDFEVYSGIKDGDSDLLFAAEYNTEEDKFYIKSTGDDYDTKTATIDCLTVDYSKAAATDACIWFKEIGDNYSVGTVYQGTKSLNGWTMSIVNASNTGLSDQTTTCAWSSVASTLYNATMGTASAGFRYSDFLYYTTKSEAMMTMTFVHTESTVLTVGLSFTEYDSIRVNLSTVDLQNSGSSVVSGGIVANNQN